MHAVVVQRGDAVGEKVIRIPASALDRVRSASDGAGEIGRDDVEGGADGLRKRTASLPCFS